MVWVWFSRRIIHVFQDLNRYYYRVFLSSSIFILVQHTDTQIVLTKHKLYPRKRLQLISASHLSCFHFHLKHYFVNKCYDDDLATTMAYLKLTIPLPLAVWSKSFFNAVSKKARDSRFNELPKRDTYQTQREEKKREVKTQRDTEWTETLDSLLIVYYVI